jgi:CRP-like cAMP-binding protein
MQLDDAATILSSAEFFDVCDADQRRLLAFASERRVYSSGEVIYGVGESSDGAHVLVAGVVSATPDDASRPYEIREPGALIGAMALLLNKPRPVTVTALTGVETLFVPRSAFRKLIQQSPDLAQRAARRLEREIGSYLKAIEPLRQKMGRDRA